MVGVKAPGAPVALPFNQNVGETIPPDTPHAVSVSLPTWKANVGYEEGEKWVVDKMQCGYPRYVDACPFYALAVMTSSLVRLIFI